MLLLIGPALSMFTKLLIEDPRAKCLDGSAPPIYLEDTGYADTILYFEGGGTCVLPTLSLTYEACLQRSKTYLGSSKYEPQNFTMLLELFSNDPNINPTFYKHRKAYIRYCDGSLHQGYRNSPFAVNNTDLYIRGSGNTVAVIDYLDRVGWLKGNVAVSGSSAGGVAVGMWATNISKRVGGKTRAIVDSGLFFPLSGKGGPLMQLVFQNLFNFTNENRAYFPQGNCSDHSCYYPQQIFTKNLVRTLILNSNYDEWNLQSALQLNCVHGHSFKDCSQSDQNLALTYYAASKKAIADWPHSYWTISCIFHGILSAQVFGKSAYRPNQNGPTAKEALHKWFTQDVPVKVDDREYWPANSPCAFASALS